MELASQGAIPQIGGTKNTAVFRGGAIALSVGLVVLSAVVAIVGNRQGPEIRAFLPICATLWATAELLTAFLLLSQFYVAGRIGFLLIASAYGLSGLLTVPYLAAFPGIFTTPHSLGDLQISAWLWVIWHATFPIVVGAAHVIDPTLERRCVPRAAIRRVLLATIGGVTSVAVTIASVIYAVREHIVRVVLPGGHFTHEYSTYVAPAIVAANLFACIVVSVRLRRSTQLQMWVAVALLTSALDGILNAMSPSRYTLSWYVGKLESLTTASLLLIMLLLEVATLYRRLFDAASIDALTELPNRRALDSSLGRMLERQPFEENGLAMLVLDLDNFKRFNDTYGHALGDDVLRVVARVLRSAVLRPHDIVARYGGEEFVVVLPDTTADGARHVAERIRLAVGASPIPLGDGSFAYVTTSIGLAYAPRSKAIAGEDLFERADRALYAAKARGRNCVVASDLPSSRVRPTSRAEHVAAS